VGPHPAQAKPCLGHPARSGNPPARQLCRVLSAGFLAGELGLEFELIPRAILICHFLLQVVVAWVECIPPFPANDDSQ